MNLFQRGGPIPRRLYTIQGETKFFFFLFFFTTCTEEPRGQTFNRPKRERAVGHTPRLVYIREGERRGSAVHFSRRDAPRTRLVVLPPLSLWRRSQRVMIRREVDRKNENSSMCRPLLCLPVPRAIWPPYRRSSENACPDHRACILSTLVLPPSPSLFCAFLTAPFLPDESSDIVFHGDLPFRRRVHAGSALCIQGRGNIEKGLPRWQLIQ